MKFIILFEKLKTMFLFETKIDACLKIDSQRGGIRATVIMHCNIKVNMKKYKICIVKLHKGYCLSTILRVHTAFVLK